MAAGLEKLISELKFEPTGVPSPDGESGQWQQLFSRFGRHGFVRCLVEGHSGKLLCHFAVPGWDEHRSGRLVEGLNRGTNRWYAGKLDGAHALHAQVESDWTDAVLVATRLGDFADSNETADQIVSLLLNEKLEAVQKAPSSHSTAPFEEIGALEIRPAESVATTPALRIQPRGPGFHVTLQMGRELSVGELENTARAVRRQLRSFLDVDVEILPGASHRAVELEVRVAEWAEGLSHDTLEAGIVRHLKGLLEVAEHGVSPAVFLGLEPAPAGRPPSMTETPTVVHGGPQAPARVAEVSKPEKAQTDVVFSIPSQGPLKPGKFDDARLSDEDTTGALVDVVLRHPGYSDRRVGQVLSILLSIEYHTALRLMQNAPIVIARGVVRDRALTMREVITGAGGKVQLTDPGHYPAA